jgi:hypothetical protein
MKCPAGSRVYMFVYAFLSMISISSLASVPGAPISGTAPGVQNAVPNTPSNANSLSDSQRSSLRFKLENLYNQVDLAVRNQHADESDLKRQVQTSEALRIYDRIPFQPKLGEVLPQLIESAHDSKVTVKDFKWLDAKTHNVSLSKQAEKVAEAFPFRFIAEGTEARVRTWIHGWTDSVVRIIEPEGGVQSPKIQAVGKNLWLVEARAFRFKNVRAPRITLEDPQSLLPEWAKKNPQLFAQQEPVLWNLVQKTEKSAPRAAELLPTHEVFRLNEFRLGFFFLKAGATE